jgi:hypothetical protein
MKKNLFKSAVVLAAFFITANVNAALIFQGSSSPSTTVTQTPAEARAAWEAELQSFDIDDLSGASGSGTFTSTFGNTYSETGNGSSISSSGINVYGNRGGASLIQFDVLFPNPVNAVGFDVNDNDGGGMLLELTNTQTGLIESFQFASVAGSGRTEFFGVIFDTTTFISSLRVGGTDPGGITTWDNFTTGVGENAVNPDVSVPEPSTLAIFALGMMGLASRKFKKKS